MYKHHTQSSMKSSNSLSSNHSICTFILISKVEKSQKIVEYLICDTCQGGFIQRYGGCLQSSIPAAYQSVLGQDNAYRYEWKYSVKRGVYNV